MIFCAFSQLHELSLALHKSIWPQRDMLHALFCIAIARLGTNDNHTSQVVDHNHTDKALCLHFYDLTKVLTMRGTWIRRQTN
jgi:hypothetical protein